MANWYDSKYGEENRRIFLALINEMMLQGESLVCLEAEAKPDFSQ